MTQEKDLKKARAVVKAWYKHNKINLDSGDSWVIAWDKFDLIKRIARAIRKKGGA